MNSIAAATKEFHRTRAGLLSMVFAAACASGTGAPASGNTAEVSGSTSQVGDHVDAVLQRTSPALSITQNENGEIAIKLRAPTSDYTGAESVPLYILNGAPFHPGPGGALTGINPHDIAAVKFLRSSEAGLYGLDGSNGVIVITLKKSNE